MKIDKKMFPIQIEKELLRQKLLQIRKNVLNPIEKSALASHNAAQLVANNNIIAIYVPFSNEISTKILAEKLRGMKKIIALPVVEGCNAPLLFKIWHNDAPLIKGICNSLEPQNDAEIIHPDAIIVPLVGFNRQGYRLGMGGGYYDRTIAQLRIKQDKPKFIGYAFDEQEIVHMPIGDFDQKLDAVITPSAVMQAL